MYMCLYINVFNSPELFFNCDLFGFDKFSIECDRRKIKMTCQGKKSNITCHKVQKNEKSSAVYNKKLGVIGVQMLI